MRIRNLVLTIAVSSSIPTAAPALIGQTKSPGAFAAHTIMILKRDGARSSFCSGVLLTRRIILTGGHCVSDAADTRVHFKDARGLPVLLEPVRIARHPGFKPDVVQKRRASVDLALVAVAEDLPPSFKPADLAADTPPRPGETFFVAGFGEREDKKAGALAALALELREPLSSLLMWLSAPNPPGGACDGDSGAPVFDADGRLAGVVAFAEGEAGQSCGKLTQAIRVAPFRSWIENTVEQWAR